MNYLWHISSGKGVVLGISMCLTMNSEQRSVPGMREGLGETGREKDEGWPAATRMETMGNKQVNWRRELGTIRPAK